MYNGLIINRLLEDRRLKKVELIDYLEYPREAGNSSLKQIITGNPTVKKLEPIADFFQVSMDVFFERKVSFSPSTSIVNGNGNAIGNGNTITISENEYKLKIENLEKLLDEKDKRIETLETLVEVLQNKK
ncbi:XRE family transcriptional regulator [Bacteroides cellulosilyticus]|jgi:hypothetical protein|uniref:XRE family transcriptional regulator n=1 Tax=Bacteroides cellulosilyticus TaxID=246787 RepID=UPI001D090B45|nr:XRE family transcriptional regulator [Bacteroides cellulosilyticus]MCB6272045.1 XRE family transcriptional regulator [Bacteroides cellulosilyticus]MCG4972318.1 XRE family transcriptional regulator [Bacteroides cellulosilyticus]